MIQESCNKGSSGAASVSAADIIAVGSNGHVATSGKVSQRLCKCYIPHPYSSRVHKNVRRGSVHVATTVDKESLSNCLGGDENLSEH